MENIRIKLFARKHDVPEDVTLWPDKTIKAWLERESYTFREYLSSCSEKSFERTCRLFRESKGMITICRIWDEREGGKDKFKVERLA
jgi:hypothetical protein